MFLSFAFSLTGDIIETIALISTPLLRNGDDSILLVLFCNDEFFADVAAESNDNGDINGGDGACES